MAGKYDRAKLKAEIADGRLTIPGHEGEWHQGTLRPMWVEVTDLVLYQGVTVDKGVGTRVVRLSGNGRVRKDSLRLAGWDDRCTILPVSVKAALPQEDGNGYVPYTCTVGFIPGQEDFRNEDAWFMEVHLAPEEVDRMVAAYRAGEMAAFSIAAKIDLWISAGDEYAPPGYGVTWHLVPSTRGSDFPEMADGKVAVVSWGDAKRRPDPDEDDAPEPVVAAPEPVLQPAVGPELAAAVERLRATVLQIGGAIAVALVVGWFV